MTMDLTQILADQGGTDAVSRELGIDRQTAQAGIGALLPAVLDGLRGQTGATGVGGLGNLGAILGSLGGGSLLTNVLAPEPTDVSQGNDVLGKIFGNKDTSRAVAADAAQKTGLSSDLLKKMLPFVAMLAAGYIAKQMGQRHQQPTAAPVGGQPQPAPQASEPDDGFLGSLLRAGSGGVLGSIIAGMTRK
jgi:hypothetical protein